MVGSSDEQGHLPTSRQALDRTPLLFPMILLTILLTSLIAAGSVSAQESAACDQYECAGMSATCDQYGCTGDPTPEEPDPVVGIGPTDAGTSAVEPAPPVERESPPEVSVPASAGDAQYQTGDPTPAPQPDLMLTETEATDTPPPGEDLVEDEIESNNGVTASENSVDESAGPEIFESINDVGNGNEEDEKDKNLEESLPGYPYEGDLCEESDCGIEEVEEHMKCVTYQTASGKRIYGCADPRILDDKGCYEITFYTAEGKPYSNLNTCAGERPYEPPEPPPEGNFDYFEPPDKPYSGAGWDGHTEDQCSFNKEGEWVEPPRGRPDSHCGLEDLPARYNCNVYYGTVHGTVRGCFKQYPGYMYEDPVTGCSRPLHLYDEVGREIGTYESCPKMRQEACKVNNCGAPVPEDWTCRREHWDYMALYGGEKRTYRRCVSPDFYEYINNERPPCKVSDAKRISAIYDERGKRVNEITCAPGGAGGDLGEWAGLEAKQADETLNRTEGTGGSGLPGDTEARANAEEPVTGIGMPPASDAPETKALLEDTGNTWRYAGTPDASNGSGPEFFDATVTNAGGHSSKDELFTSDDEAGNDGNSPRSPADGHSPTAGSMSDDDRDLGDGSLSKDKTSCFLDRMLAPCDALPDSQGIRSPVKAIIDKVSLPESFNDSVSANAAHFMEVLTGGNSVEAATSETTSGSVGGPSDWSARLVPLAGLTAAGGVFMLRRRFFG